MNERLQSIRPRLQELARLDPDMSVADTYDLVPPLSEADVLAFEEQHSIVLPSDYRRFLLEVGSHGAGPNYGLHPLGSVRPGFLASPFPLSKWLDVANNPGNLSEDEIDSDKWVMGTLDISDHGCGISDLLVVSGEERGHIWTDDRTNDGGIYPIAPNREELGQSQEDTILFIIAETENERTTFLDWYEWWLDWCAEEIRTLDEL